MGTLRLLNKNVISSEYIKAKDLIITPINSNIIKISSLPSILNRIINLNKLKRIIEYKYLLKPGNTKTLSLDKELDLMIMNIKSTSILIDIDKIKNYYKTLLDLSKQNNYKNIVLIEYNLNNYIYEDIYKLLDLYTKLYDINIDLIIS